MLHGDNRKVEVYHPLGRFFERNKIKLYLSVSIRLPKRFKKSLPHFNFLPGVILLLL